MALFDTSKKDEQVKKLQEEIDKLKSQYNKEPEPEEIKGKNERRKLYSWIAPVRIHVIREKEWYTGVALWILLFCIIVLFFKQYTLIFLILAISALSYILSKRPPAKAEHTIYSTGIEYFDKVYVWEDLDIFWISMRNDQYMMTITTKVRFPTALTMVVPKENIPDIVKILNKYIRYKESKKEQNWFSKIFDGVSVKYEDINSI